eukprot:scaffold66303_cov50-Cyclotella_meneghiniana.AAC.1
MVRINLFGGSGLQNIMIPHYDVETVTGTMTWREEAGFLLENIAVDVLFALSLMIRVVSCCVMVLGLVR